jgi:glycosyltransferase involved in cell wall biosynthesis
MTQASIALVVPCFDEESRLDRAAFVALLDDMPALGLVFVDDGSRDQTLAILHALARERPGRIEVVALTKNQGKAEAVRRGLLHALASPVAIAGFIDADLSTPPAEILRLTELARGGLHDVVMGSRVQLLGRSINRKSARHYLGRIFATCASLSLGLPVYDTQCGAKLFRRTEALAAALAEPFSSRWAFDVELLARLIRPRSGVPAIPVASIWEEPLLTWTDVPGSKMRLATALWTGLELVRIGWKLRRR